MDEILTWVELLHVGGVEPFAELLHIPHRNVENVNAIVRLIRLQVNFVPLLTANIEKRFVLGHGAREVNVALGKLRQLLQSNVELARKLATHEKKCDAQYKVVFDAIRELTTPPALPPKRIGFRDP